MCNNCHVGMRQCSFVLFFSFELFVSSINITKAVATKNSGCHLSSTTPARHCSTYSEKDKKSVGNCFMNCIYILMVQCSAAYCSTPITVFFFVCEVKETSHWVSFLELAHFFGVYFETHTDLIIFQWNLLAHIKRVITKGMVVSILLGQFQRWSASIRSFLLPSNLLSFCLYSCGTMTSRKKVLLKVIILGDSGWVMKGWDNNKERLPDGLL